MMPAYYQKGLHVGECIAQWMGQSDNDKKTPYFALKFMILARVEGDREIAVEQNERSVYLYLSEKALDMTTDVLAFLGYEKDSLRFLDPAAPNYHSFAGKKCDLWCKVEEYNGDTKEKWSISMPLDRQITPIDDKELRRLDALFGKSIKGKRSPQAESTRQEPAPTAVAERQERATAPPPGDDIPF
jgi:hypothetical protein